MRQLLKVANICKMCWHPDKPGFIEFVSNKKVIECHFRNVLIRNKCLDENHYYSMCKYDFFQAYSECTVIQEGSVLKVDNSTWVPSEKGLLPERIPFTGVIKLSPYKMLDVFMFISKTNELNFVSASGEWGAVKADSIIAPELPKDNEWYWASIMLNKNNELTVVSIKNYVIPTLYDTLVGKAAEYDSVLKCYKIGGAENEQSIEKSK